VKYEEENQNALFPDAFYIPIRGPFGRVSPVVRIEKAATSIVSRAPSGIPQAPSPKSRNTSVPSSTSLITSKPS